MPYVRTENGPNIGKIGQKSSKNDRFCYRLAPRQTVFFLQAKSNYGLAFWGFRQTVGGLLMTDD